MRNGNPTCQANRAATDAGSEARFFATGRNWRVSAYRLVKLIRAAGKLLSRGGFGTNAELLGKYTAPNVADDDEGYYLVGALVQEIDADVGILQRLVLVPHEPFRLLAVFCLQARAAAALRVLAVKHAVPAAQLHNSILLFHTSMQGLPRAIPQFLANRYAAGFQRMPVFGTYFSAYRTARPRNASLGVGGRIEGRLSY